MVEGFLNILKPPGMSSHDVVRTVRRSLRAKAGHTGTLDPAAAGVLVVAVGSATRLIRYLSDQSKAYRAEITLGVCTDTLDAEGSVVGVSGAVVPDEAAVWEALQALSGEIDMVPPAYSAVHVSGRRAYELARKGAKFEVPSRRVHIENFAQVRVCDGCFPRLTVDIDCSTGTYVRSLAEMLGRALGCDAYLSGLIRTRVGPHRIADSVSLSCLDDEGSEHVQCPRDALVELPAVGLDECQSQRVLNGNPVDAPAGMRSCAAVRLVGPGGRLVAIAECTEMNGRQVLQPRTVLMPDDGKTASESGA